MPRPDRLDGRNGDVWRDYCAGSTQEALAERYGVSQQRVSQIITLVRSEIPPADLEEARQKTTDVLAELQEMAVDIARQPAAQAYSNGRPMTMTDGTGNEVPIMDYGGRLQAIRTAAEVSKRVASLLGLDAPAKVEHGLSADASQAAASAAADAVTRLHGG